MLIAFVPNWLPKESRWKTNRTAGPSGGEDEAADHSLSAPLVSEGRGGEGRGEVGAIAARATSPALAPNARAPSPPRRAERGLRRRPKMAGTDKSPGGGPAGPAILPVEPHLGPNI